MRIETFLKQSPVFCVSLAARRFETLTTRLLEGDDLNFLQALILATLFFEPSAAIKPSQLAAIFGTTRGNVSHCVSALEAKGLIQRRIDPEDARAYHLTLKAQGKKAAIRVIGALDRMQLEFESQVGKETLQFALRTVRALAEG